LDAWLSYGGAQSVRAAVEANPKLGGKCSTLIVDEMVTVRPLTIGDAAYVTCEFNITVHA
jgi:hypothetical protein